MQVTGSWRLPVYRKVGLAGSGHRLNTLDRKTSFHLRVSRARFCVVGAALAYVAQIRIDVFFDL